MTFEEEIAKFRKLHELRIQVACNSFRRHITAYTNETWQKLWPGELPFMWELEQERRRHSLTADQEQG